MTKVGGKQPAAQTGCFPHTSALDQDMASHLWPLAHLPAHPNTPALSPRLWLPPNPLDHQVKDWMINANHRAVTHV